MAAFENTLTAGLIAAAKMAPDAMERALYEFAQGVMTVAKERTPVDEGTLKSSGVVDLPVRHGDDISVLLGFGGAAASYAIYVHEDMEAKHEVGQAKFLSSALDDASGHFIDEVSANFARAMGM